MDADERTHLEELMQIYQKRLRILERQRATHGIDTSPQIQTEIDYIQAKLIEIEKQLKNDPKSRQVLQQRKDISNSQGHNKNLILQLIIACGILLFGLLLVMSPKITNLSLSPTSIAFPTATSVPSIATSTPTSSPTAQPPTATHTPTPSPTITPSPTFTKQSINVNSTCPDTLSRSQVKAWAAIGSIDRTNVGAFIREFNDLRSTGNYDAGATIPAGAVIATDFGAGESYNFQKYPVIPLVHYRSSGLFETKEEFVAPYAGACIMIVEN